MSAALSSESCWFLFIFLTVVALLALPATSTEVSPRHALAGADTTLTIKDVTLPYTTCKTTFKETEAGQAVFARIVNSTEEDTADALCVVRASLLDDNNASIEGSIVVSQARGPRAEPEVTSSYKVKFSQAPRVEASWVRYTNKHRYGSVVVQLSSIQGLVQGGPGLQQLFQLSVDLSVLQRAVLHIPLESVTHTDEQAELVFVLPELIPSGEYPCMLTVNSNPLPLATVSAPAPASEPMTRTSDLFNGSDTALAAPLLQPARSHTFLIQTQLPVVRVLPSTIPRQALQCNQDVDSEAATDSSNGCGGDGERTEGELAVHLDGPLTAEAAALLAVFPVDLPPENVTDSVWEWGESGVPEDAITDTVLELRSPSDGKDEVTISFTWVRWYMGTSRKRVITLREPEAWSNETEYVVRVVSAVGALPDTTYQSAIVGTSSSSSNSPEASSAPKFSVRGQQVVHRGEDVTFDVLRSGSTSPLLSVVQWRLVYLDPQSDPPMVVSSPSSLASSVVPEEQLHQSIHLVSNITAALNGTGTISWQPWSIEPSQTVHVPIEWSKVPYVARWMLAVQLSILRNGDIAEQMFTAQSASPPHTDAVSPVSSQTDVLVPAVMGSAQSRALITNAIVYGVPLGLCPAGTGSKRPSARGPPLPEYVQPGSVQSLSLRIRESQSEAAHFQWMPSMPPFNATVTQYDLMVPFGSGPVSLVLATSSSATYVLSGCGSKAALPASTNPVSARSPEAVQQLVWPLAQPSDKSRCTAEVHVCSGIEEQCSKDTAFEEYKVVITWLDDPAMARIRAVNITVGDDGAPVRVCTSDSQFQEDAGPCPVGARVRPGTNSTHPHCVVDECISHSVVSTGLTYHRGEEIRIAVEPFINIGRINIGQRVFYPGSSLKLERVSVAFTLFDSTDRLSPFVPFFIRSRSRSRTVLDVPITLTLSDGRTSAPFNLLLAVDVLPARKSQKPAQSPPARPSLSIEAVTGGEAPPTPVKIVTEAAGVAVVDGDSSEGPSVSPLSADEQFDSVVSGGGAGRKLHDVSSSAPKHQQWTDDPLLSPQCSLCGEGFFSYGVDTLCQMCRPGTCAPQAGMTECAVCPRGAYASVHGASSCSPCVHGSYAQLPGSSACRLCPFGFTTTSDGASVCDQLIQQTVAVGKEHALAVSLSVRISGADFEDVPRRTGVLGPSEDILRFLVSLDSSKAFGVSTRDVEVNSMVQLKRRELRVNITTNLPINAPPGANRQQLEEAVGVAQLSKDSGIGNLTWTHTTEALGAKAVTEDYIRTVVRAPDPRGGTPWQAIVFPVIAGIVIVGSALLLKIRRSREQGPLETVAQTPSMLIATALHAMRSSVFRVQRSHMSDGGMSEIGVTECGDDLEIDMSCGRPQTVHKRSRSNTEGAIEIAMVNLQNDARKRTHTDTEL